MSTTDTQALQLRDEIQQKTVDGRTLKFEVISVVHDECDPSKSYLVCYSADHDTFVVTDPYGTLIEDDDLAQEIIDETMVLAEQATA